MLCAAIVAVEHLAEHLDDALAGDEERRAAADVALLAQEDDEGRIEQPGPGFIGFIEPPPAYQPGPRRTLPAWAKHLRDLRPLKLVE